MSKCFLLTSGVCIKPETPAKEISSPAKELVPLEQPEEIFIEEPSVEEPVEELEPLADPSTLPQERPAKIRYTKSMIMDFIRRDVAKSLPESVIKFQRSILMEKLRKKAGSFPHQGKGNFGKSDRGQMGDGRGSKPSDRYYEDKKDREPQPNLSMPLNLSVTLEGKNLWKKKVVENKIFMTVTVNENSEKKEITNMMDAKISLPLTVNTGGTYQQQQQAKYNQSKSSSFGGQGGGNPNHITIRVTLTTTKNDRSLNINVP